MMSDSHEVVGSQLDNDMTPRQIVEYLNKHIVGQQDAKRAISIAMVISAFSCIMLMIRES
jgi:ATP-dependent protease Clp ATPase subunit